MSLIEQLGGYKKLRPHFILTDSALGYTHVYLHGNNHYCFLDDRVDYIIPERAFSVKRVVDALLEYRRQHNIFEVDDLVVFEGEAGLNGLFRIEALTKTGKPKTVKTGRFGNFPCRYCTVRHATDAEIEAYCRLDLPESVVKSLGEVS